MIKLKDYTKLDEREDYNQLEGSVSTQEGNTDYKGFRSKDEFISKMLEIPKQNVIIFPKDDNDDNENASFSILSSFNGWWTREYVGFLEVNGESIFIGSRFDANDTFYFTHYILSEALGLKARLFPDMHVNVGIERILEELLSIVFINQIDFAYRKGIYRKYQTFEKNDPKIRGKIDIARHIRSNLLFNGNIAYSYREFTIDNEINRLILTAYDLLEKRCGELLQYLTRTKREVLNYISQLRNKMQPASRQETKDLLKRVNRKIVHPFYKDWEAVRKTSLLILRHMGIHINDMTSHDTTGILIDMNKIWEMYLEKVMRTNLPNIIWVNPQEKKFFLKRNSSFKMIYPDFCLYNNHQNNQQQERHLEMILDAKYKNSWESIAEYNEDVNKWPREDCFQLVSYMHIFACHKGGIICPVKQKKNTLQNFIEASICSKGNKDEKFLVFPLKIPSNRENIGSFISDIKKNEKEFCKTIEESLQI